MPKRKVETGSDDGPPKKVSRPEKDPGLLITMSDECTIFIGRDALMTRMESTLTRLYLDTADSSQAASVTLDEDPRVLRPVLLREYGIEFNTSIRDRQDAIAQRAVADKYGLIVDQVWDSVSNDRHVAQLRLSAVGLGHHMAPQVCADANTRTAVHLVYLKSCGCTSPEVIKLKPRFTCRSISVENKENNGVKVLAHDIINACQMHDIGSLMRTCHEFFDTLANYFAYSNGMDTSFKVGVADMKRKPGAANVTCVSCSNGSRVACFWVICTYATQPATGARGGVQIVDMSNHVSFTEGY